MQNTWYILNQLPRMFETSSESYYFKGACLFCNILQAKVLFYLYSGCKSKLDILLSVRSKSSLCKKF